MPSRPPTHRPAHVTSHARPKQLSAHRRGYTRSWQRASKAFLAENPLCAECDRQGRLTAAVVVDHIRPHKGDAYWFWTASNWQPLCITCHNAKSATERSPCPPGERNP